MNCYEVSNPATPEEAKRWVAESDSIFDRKLSAVVDNLAKDDDLCFLGLTGPTCSGKTTAARLLEERLEARGKNLQVISIDDFYYDKNVLADLSRKNGSGQLDYDSEATIDVELLERCVLSLRKGNPTRLPHFNFRSGLREQGVLVQPQPEDVFLFEGIQILYPSVRKILQGGSYRSLFIHPLSAIRQNGVLFEPNEIRLLRRLVRDFRYRACLPDFTLTLWEGVRKNEESSIFPYASLCEETVDSTMPYEIGMLKPYLQTVFSKVSPNSPADTFYQTLKTSLATIEDISSDYLSPKSLYKEFI